MVTLREGDRINNYLLEARLGVGSFGEVWRARHHVFDDLVAIKIPTDDQYVRNLRREGVAVHGLRHQNIVRAIDLDPYGDPPYFIMELVEGPSLREAIDRYGREFPIDAAVEILRGVLAALSTAHDARLIHRDIKPGNILLAHPLDEMATISRKSVKVTDFGLGKIGGVTSGSLIQSGSLSASEGRGIAGTIAYMSPEQKTGGDIDGRSDLYACGIVLFEMLTGERPQGNDRPGALRPDMPKYLGDVFAQSYTRLERRFESAEQMRAALVPAAMLPADGPVAAAKPRDSVWVLADGGTRCPGCSLRVNKDDQFCIKCGRQLVPTVPRCPNAGCQAYVHTRDRFCVMCGASLETLDPSAGGRA